MRCKQGDIAMFVRSKCGNEGKVVSCLRLATPDELSRHGFLADPSLWVVDVPVRLISKRDGSVHLLPYAHDYNLFPIRPEADPVTTDVVDEVSA